MSPRSRVAVVVTALAAVAIGTGGVGEEPASPDYQVASVKRRLFRELPTPEVLLEVGDRPEAGNLLRTGSRSSAEIVSPGYGARFRLGSKTRARLAGDHPGVLLEIERGRLRALFDALGGEDPPERIVTTPSAVLAVRGTEYGVEVDRSGDTMVTVFEGVVEVVDRDRSGPPIRVPAGQYSTVRRGQPPSPPQPHQVGPADWDRGRRPESAGPRRPGEPIGGMGSQGRGEGGSAGSPRQPQRGGGGHGRG